MRHSEATQTALNHYHFIGIGGIGMSALARLLIERGAAVSGSDLSINENTKTLEKLGAKISIGHFAENVSEFSTVVYTTGVSLGNPEFQAAKTYGCELLHRSDLLKHVSLNHKILAVTGTHGKTTTSALLTHVLLEAEKNPAFAIGGILPQYGKNGGDGKGDYFVIEACESDGTFLKYNPFGAILTNIDTDHLDFFGSEKALNEAFLRFCDSVQSKEHFFWCGDDAGLGKLPQLPGVSYGFKTSCELRITHFLQTGWQIVFDIEYRGKRYEKITLPLIGRHNVLNAAAVFGLALSLGLSEDAIKKAFLTFLGVKRRCELKGTHKGIIVLDDYGHHPTELKTTLEGIRQAVGERRILVAYQPHRYTRTRDCMGQFTSVFNAADEVILTDIYGAGEQPMEGITDALVYEDLQKSTKNVPLTFVKKSELIPYLADHLRPYDVLVTFGAGDITHIGKTLLENFKERQLKKLRVGVVFGGRSSEHEISLLSVRNIIKALNTDYYDIEYFGITKEGKWIAGEEARDCLVNDVVVSKERTALVMSGAVMDKIQACDLLFPVLHGPFGEDGTIQGFFEMLGKPYVGCCSRSAGICMDKAITKELMLYHSLPTVEFVTVKRHEWKNQSKEICDEIGKSLTFPVFVKPVHLGSTVGVQKVKALSELESAIDFSFQYDNKLIVERGLTMREIEFSVLGNDWPQVFPPGEILTQGQFYNYEKKYGAHSFSVTERADLSEEKIAEGMALAKKAYQIAGCRGMARVDFFLDESGKFWLNEINPIPGFTANSLYPRMCHVNGLTTTELVDKLISLAYR